MPPVMITGDTKNWLPDWAIDMAQVPFNPMQDLAAFNFSTGGPCSALPEADRPKRPAGSATQQCRSAGGIAVAGIAEFVAAELKTE